MNNVVRLLLLSAVPSVFRSLLFASALCMLYADAAHSQWVPTNGPFYMHATYSLVTSRSNAGITLFAGTQRGLVYRTTDNGNTWIRTDGRDPTSLDTGFANRDVGSLVVSRGYLFAGTTPYGSGIFRLAVNDTHWIAVNNGLTNLNVFRLMAYADGAGDTALYVGTGGGIFRSTDNGGSWVARNVGLTDPTIGALAYTTHDSGQSTLFAGTYWGLHISTDAGEHWRYLEQSPYAIGSILVVRKPTGRVLVYAGRRISPGGLFRSSDNGANWIPVNTGLPEYAGVDALAAYDTVIFAGIYASADRALFYSLDDGDHWIVGSYGLRPSCGDIRALAVSDTSLFAGIGGCEPSVWRRPLSEMITGVEDEDVKIPSDFSLEQNFPNPFNPATTIKYDLPYESKVTLKIFNLLGQDIGTLVNEHKQPGRYEVQWNAGNFPSGVYVYRLIGGSYQKSGKMLLMK